MNAIHICVAPRMKLRILIDFSSMYYSAKSKRADMLIKTRNSVTRIFLCRSWSPTLTLSHIADEFAYRIPARLQALDGISSFFVARSSLQLRKRKRQLHENVSDFKRVFISFAKPLEVTIPACQRPAGCRSPRINPPPAAGRRPPAAAAGILFQFLLVDFGLILLVD
jgi:hypothetical protein